MDRSDPLIRDSDDEEFKAQLQALLKEVDRIVAASRKSKSGKLYLKPQKPAEEWDEQDD